MGPRDATSTERPWQLLAVTFDLTQTSPGDPRYAQADYALSAHGQVFNPVKQMRFLLTRSPSAAVRRSLEQRLGTSATLMILPLRRVHQINIRQREKRRQMRALAAAVEAVGLEIPGLANY